MVDVESTGLDVDYHWPIEVAAINVTTGEELYFVPDVPKNGFDQADGAALKINRYFERGIFAKRLHGPDNEHAWEALWDMLRGNTLGGSNPTFDAAMLLRGYRHRDRSVVNSNEAGVWHHRLADLSAYSAGRLGLGPNELVGLADVCAALKVDNRGEHTALGDARATAECFIALADYYRDRNSAVSA